jgi:hypothetical protein
MCGRVFDVPLWCGVLAFLFQLATKKPKAAWALAIPCAALTVAALVAIVKDADLAGFALQFALLLIGGYLIFLVILIVDRVLSRG